jgi:hypothetical protein
MILRTSVDPSSFDRCIHSPDLHTEDCVCQVYLPSVVPRGRLSNAKPRDLKRSPGVFISFVFGIVAAAMRLEVFNVGEVLADDQQFRFLVAQPLRPMAHHGRAECILSTVAEHVRIAVDAEAATLAGGNQIVVFHCAKG